MKTVGLMRVKNAERWIKWSLAAQWFCDTIVILDGNSTDNTEEICRSFKNVDFREGFDDQLGFDEGRDREHLSKIAHFYNPDWISSPDADEVYLDDTWDLIQPALHDPKVPVIELHNVQLWNDYFTVRVDGNWAHQYRQRFWRFKSGKLTYAKNNCALPEEITERPFARIGKLLHYGNIDKADRLAKHARNVEQGMEHAALISEEGIKTMPLEDFLRA